MAWNGCTAQSGAIAANKILRIRSKGLYPDLGILDGQDDGARAVSSVGLSLAEDEGGLLGYLETKYLPGFVAMIFIFRIVEI